MSQVVYFIENKSRGPQIAAEVLDTLQSTEKLLERAFICATGNNVILCGVVNLGSGVYSEGIIIWNNELFFFEGGTFGQYIVVNEQTTECNFCSGDRYRIFTIRTAKFTNSVSPGQEYLPVTPNIPELYHLTYNLVTLNQEVININNDIDNIYDEIDTINNFIDNIDNYITNFITNINNWDLTFDIGEIIGVSSAKVSQFDFTTPATAGIGKPGRYAKWAVCNGNNGTMDYGGVTLRGYKYNDNAHNFTTLGGGSDLIFLDKDNIPAHRHKYTAQYLEDDDNTDRFLLMKNLYLDPQLHLPGVIDHNFNILQTYTWGESGGGLWMSPFSANTGDGTDNISNQDELPIIPDPIDITNEYRTIVLIQKIA